MVLDISASIYGLPHSLVTPIAAKNISAIETYAGKIIDSSYKGNAFVVECSHSLNV